MRRSAVLLVLAMTVLGCEGGEQPARGARRGVEPAQYAPPQGKMLREPVDTPRPENPRELPEFGATAEEEVERDLDAELKAAIGTPTVCVRDFAAPRPTKLRITVSATVRPTGMVIMPSVYGTGLSRAARECIERRVENVVLPRLDERVSRPVSTLIEIDYTPEVIVEAETGVPEPRLRDVQKPLPKRPAIELGKGEWISGWPTENWISGGFDGGVPIQKPTSRKVQGPKPRAIEGYEVDQNAQKWSD